MERTSEGGNSRETGFKWANHAHFTFYSLPCVQPRCCFTTADIRGCAIDFHSIPSATSWWWEHYWTRCTIELQHIECTLTLISRVTFTKVEFSAALTFGEASLWRGCSIATGKTDKGHSLILFQLFLLTALFCRLSHWAPSFAGKLKHYHRSCYKIHNRKRQTTFTIVEDDFRFEGSTKEQLNQKKRTGTNLTPTPGSEKERAGILSE